jgi:hypothetical protein
VKYCNSSAFGHQEHAQKMSKAGLSGRRLFKDYSIYIAIGRRIGIITNHDQQVLAMRVV